MPRQLFSVYHELMPWSRTIMYKHVFFLFLAATFYHGFRGWLNTVALPNMSVTVAKFFMCHEFGG